MPEDFAGAESTPSDSDSATIRMQLVKRAIAIGPAA